MSSIPTSQLNLYLQIVSTLVQRKFRRKMGDVEFLLLLEITREPGSFSSLVVRSGASSSGTWHSLRLLLLPPGNLPPLVRATSEEGITIYRVTAAGVAELRQILL